MQWINAGNVPPPDDYKYKPFRVILPWHTSYKVGGVVVHRNDKFFQDNTGDIWDFNQVEYLAESSVKHDKRYFIDELKLWIEQINDKKLNVAAFAEILNHKATIPSELGNAWPTKDVLRKLIFAAEYLLHEKNYDGHGWEEISHCVQRGKEILNLLTADE